MTIVRKAGVFTAIISLILGSAYTLLTPSQTYADEERVILVTGWKNSFKPDEMEQDRFSGAERGDTCGTNLDHPNVLAGWQQIMVRDENDTIIAVERLNGTYQQGSERNALRCTIELEIEVPKRNFYSVYIGEDLIATFADDEMPLGEQDRIYLIFDAP